MGRAPLLGSAGLLGVAVLAVTALPASAQRAWRTEQVTYLSGDDGTFLTGELALPQGNGPYPGVVLMSIAGADLLVQRLTGSGYAVLIPVRRGFVAVEPLLQATYRDLANDGAAAVAYLRGRPDVDDAAIALVGQGDDAAPAMMAAAAAKDAIPLVLLAPPAFPGREVFRLEQHGLGERQGRRPQELDALDRLLAKIADIALDERSPYLKEYRLEELIGGSEVQLPYNAAFPTGADQPHFFSSPLWHDRLALDPEKLLATLHGPVLLLIGTEDLDTPMDLYVEAVRRGLAAAPTRDATVCVLEDRTRHYFSDAIVSTVAAWIGGHLREAPTTPRLDGCMARPLDGR